MGNNKKQQTAASKFQIYTQLLFYIVLFIFPPISHREREPQVLSQRQTYQWFVAETQMSTLPEKVNMVRDVCWDDDPVLKKQVLTVIV